jgi:hypothetical protein
MKVKTRESNASKHPGIIDSSGVKRKRRTKAEMQADAEKKQLEKDLVEKNKKATIGRIAALEGKMAQEDVEAQSHLRPGQHPQKSRKVVDDGKRDNPDSDFQPAHGEAMSDDTDAHDSEPEIATPKPKKKKPSVRQEIKLVHAKAATEHANSEGKVSLTLLVEDNVTTNPSLNARRTGD